MRSVPVYKFNRRSLGFTSAFFTCMLIMTGCTPKPGSPVLTAPVGTQSAAQLIEAHWPAVTAGIAVAVLADGEPPAVNGALVTAEGTLGPEIAACAAGTDPTCTAQIQQQIVALFAQIKVGPKGLAEIVFVKALLAPAVPGL